MTLDAFDRDYSLVHQSYLTSEQADHDVAEILGLVSLRSGRVLDAPCGAGRIAHRLGLLGFDVDGIDLDPSALGVARRQGLGLSTGVRLMERDLRDLTGLGPYDLIISWFNSFGYFSSRENRALLGMFATLLNSSGTVVINTLDLDAVAAVVSRGPLEELLVVGGRTITTSAMLQGNRLVTTRVGVGAGPKVTTTTSVELYSRQRWREMFEAIGLNDVSLAGRSQPTNGDASVEMTVIARRGGLPLALDQEPNAK